MLFLSSFWYLGACRGAVPLRALFAPLAAGPLDAGRASSERPQPAAGRSEDSGVWRPLFYKQNIDV